MSYSKDDIKYMALSELGRKDKPNFITSRELDVQFINFKYDQVLQQTLQRYKWGWCRKRVELNEKMEATDSPYKYAFKLPDDFLYLQDKYSDNNYKQTIRDFELDWVEQLIYTNSEKCFIAYTRDVPAEKFPAYFIEYIKLKLAFDCCFKVNGDTDLLQILQQRETFEYINATNIDARQQRTREIQDAPYVTVRY